jgi:hypothetical protein
MATTESGPMAGADGDGCAVGVAGASAIAAMRDRLAIDELVTRLGRWLDGGDFAPPRDVMAEDVTVATEGGRSEGIEAVAAQAGRNHGAYRTQHVITDRLVLLDGERAEATANSIVRFDPVDSGAQSFTLGGRYRFEAARGEAGWRLVRIEIEARWQEPADALARAAAAREANGSAR